MLRRNPARCPAERQSSPRAGDPGHPSPATSTAVILYGRNPVREALRGRRSHQVREVWTTAALAREPWLQGAPRLRVSSADEIERCCGSSAHQGICAEAGGYPYVAAEDLLSAPEPLIVALDQIQDPHNLGSICRTAECVGATGVAIAERRSAEVTPAVCKTSAGAVEHLRVARVRNVADFLAQAKQAGCWCYGASVPSGGGNKPNAGANVPSGGGDKADADASAPSGGGDEIDAGADRQARLGVYRAQGPGERQATVSYAAPDYSGGVVLVLGSEGTGLRPRVAAACDQLISLPLWGKVDSLGVSAAAAALLYGILQSREERLDKVP